MFVESFSLYLTRLFQLFCEIWPIYCMKLRGVIVLKKMTSKLRDVFLHVSRAYKTRCISIQLFKHWSEPVVKIEAYHPYMQYFVIILSIFMMMRLLWLPFNDRYRKIVCIMGQYKGR